MYKILISKEVSDVPSLTHTDFSFHIHNSFSNRNSHKTFFLFLKKHRNLSKKLKQTSKKISSRRFSIVSLTKLKNIILNGFLRDAYLKKIFVKTFYDIFHK